MFLMPVRVAKERAPLGRKADAVEETGEFAEVGVKVDAFSSLAVFIKRQMEGTDRCRASVVKGSWERIDHLLRLVDVVLVHPLSGERQQGAASVVVFSHRTMGQHLGLRVTRLQPSLDHRCCHSSAVLQSHSLAQVQAMARRPHARLASDDA